MVQVSASDGAESIKKAGTESVTFRLAKELLTTIKKEAEQKEISTNTLVTQVLRHHVDWNSNAAKAGLLSFPRSLLVKLMEGYDQEEIARIAKQVATKDVADITLLLRSDYSIESFLHVVRSWITACGFPFQQSVTGSEHTYVIQHDMSMKWSKYFADVFESVFEQIGSARPEFRLTDNTFVFKVKLTPGR